jgi:hypothetical protein
MIMAAALFNAGFAIFHMVFWRLFNWPASLEPAGRVNAGIIQVLNLCIIFIFLGAAAAQVLAAEMFKESDAEPFMLGIAVFWIFRALLQPFFFTLRDWRSALLLVLFLAGAGLHIASALSI